jgi:hypothetical protein
VAERAELAGSLIDSLDKHLGQISRSGVGRRNRSPNEGSGFGPGSGGLIGIGS